MALLVIAFIAFAAATATFAILLTLFTAWLVFSIAMIVVDFAVSVVRSRWPRPMRPSYGLQTHVDPAMS
jgi:hypothetical protein